jgi:hypothetical protein
MLADAGGKAGKGEGEWGGRTAATAAHRSHTRDRARPSRDQARDSSAAAGEPAAGQRRSGQRIARRRHEEWDPGRHGQARAVRMAVEGACAERWAAWWGLAAAAAAVAGAAPARARRRRIGGRIEPPF